MGMNRRFAGLAVGLGRRIRGRPSWRMVMGGYLKYLQRVSEQEPPSCDDGRGRRECVHRETSTVGKSGQNYYIYE